MGGEAHRECVVIATQPTRCRLFNRHQIGDRLRAIVLQLGLLVRGERLQITCDLRILRRDEDETFTLRTLLEFEDALHSFAVCRITTQAVTRLGRISDETAALEVGGESSRWAGCAQQLLSSNNRLYFLPMAR